MSAKKPESMAAAINDIDKGMSAYAAAKKHGLNQSSISRALKRRENLCPSCGRPIKEKK